MLSPADRDLARRDTALPGLATLLDPEAFVAALAPRLPHAELGPARSSYVRYKPGTNCLVSYRLGTCGGEVEVHAKVHGPDARAKAEKARHRPEAPGPFGAGRLVFEEPAIVVSFFPNDDKLDALVRLADGESRRQLLRKLLPGQPELWEAEPETLRYKPERRYVARLAGEGGHRATLKFYTREDYRAARRNAKVFSDRGALRLPRRLGRSERHHAVALEWREGLSLDEVLADAGSGRGDLQTVGAALAELHAQDPRGLVRLTRQEEVTALFSLAGQIGFTCPELAGMAGELAEWLALRLSSLPPEHRPIHGDFYDEQVLLSEDTATILDLDRAVLADPATDLGLFIAHLQRGALRGDLSPDEVEPLSGALLEGYRSGGRVEEGRVWLYAACGLLKLAPDPFRHREPEWPDRTRAILQRAREIAHALPASAASR